LCLERHFPWLLVRYAVIGSNSAPPYIVLPAHFYSKTAQPLSGAEDEHENSCESITSTRSLDFPVQVDMAGLSSKVFAASLITILFAVVLNFTAPASWLGLVPSTETVFSKLPQSVTEEPETGLKLLYDANNSSVEYEHSPCA
jgi:hypothetical protein